MRRDPDPAAAPGTVVVALITSFAVGLVAACSNDGREMRPPTPEQTLSIVTTTIDPADGAEDITPIVLALSTPPPPSETEAPAFELRAPWADGDEIDRRYTCDGDDVSPALSWSAVPADAVELAIVMVDDDAQTPEGNQFIHWVVAGIDPSVTDVPEGEIPAGAYEGTNDFSTAAAPLVGYGGPCPPPGDQPHTYRLEVHALDQQLELGHGARGIELLQAIEAASIDRAVVVGTYGR